MKAGPAKKRGMPQFLVLLGILSGCSGGELDARLVDYRETLEEGIGVTAEASRPLPKADPGALSLELAGASPTNALLLPRRRERRLAVHDLRVGPFDFLATIGCPLSEVVAQRNSSMGKVLVPTRRLGHELAVVYAMNECLPKLSRERAERFKSKLSTKRAELGRHRWNAVWLDNDLERYLSFGPASLIGGADSRDGTAQLMRASRALLADDVTELESAFEQLRDDAAMGSTVALAGRAATEFERIADVVGQHSVTGCRAEERRLAQIFQNQFLPLQVELGDLSRKVMGFVDAFNALYTASVNGVEVPEEMEFFRLAVSGSEGTPGVWGRLQQSMRAHAAAWAPLLEECGVIPRP
jgi:hypothetical protein